MKRLAALVATLVAASTPAHVGAQVRVIVNGMVQDVPAGVSRTVVTSAEGTRTVDVAWTGAAVPGLYDVTTTQTDDEDDAGRVTFRVVETRITPRPATAGLPVVVMHPPQWTPPAAYAPYQAPGADWNAPRPAPYAPPRIDLDAETLGDDAAAGTPHVVRVRRDGWSGHFLADLTINGVTVKCIIDSGAAQTIMSIEDARATGVDRMIERAELAVGIGGTTRVGVARASLSIAGRDLGRTTVRVGQSGIPHTLLGQPELARIGRLVMEDGVLTIIPKGVETQLAMR